MSNIKSLSITASITTAFISHGVEENENSFFIIFLPPNEPLVHRSDGHLFR